MTVTVSRVGTRVDASEAVLDAARAAFDRVHHLQLPALLEPALLSFVLRRLKAAPFERYVHTSITPPQTDFRMMDRVLRAEIDFLLNDPRLFALVEHVTGCGPIGCFKGSLYRTPPGSQYEGSWHDDWVETRRAALALNLSDAPYAGGVLEIRDVSSERVLQHIDNRVTGDAVLFRISPDLEHRVTAVEGTRPRTTFAGWFFAEPALTVWIRGVSIDAAR